MDSAPSSFVQHNGDIDSSPLDLTGFNANGDATPTGPTMSSLNNDTHDQFTQTVQLPDTTPGSSQQNIIEEKMEDSHSTIQLAGLSEEQSPDHHPPTVQGSSQSGVSDISSMSALPGEFEVTGDGQTSITDLLLILWPSLRLEMQADSSFSQPYSPVESENEIDETEEDTDLDQDVAPYMADSSFSQLDSPVESENENDETEEDTEFYQDVAPYMADLSFGETEEDTDLDQDVAPYMADSSFYQPDSPDESENETVEDTDLAQYFAPFTVVFRLELVRANGVSWSRATKETIQAGVGQRKYQRMELGTSAEDDICCICLESYADGDVLGKIRCGHEYHYNCIEEWLLLKNKCPFCNGTAV